MFSKVYKRSLVIFLFLVVASVFFLGCVKQDDVVVLLSPPKDISIGVKGNQEAGNIGKLDTIEGDAFELIGSFQTVEQQYSVDYQVEWLNGTIKINDKAEDPNVYVYDGLIPLGQMSPYTMNLTYRARASFGDTQSQWTQATFVVCIRQVAKIQEPLLSMGRGLQKDPNMESQGRQIIVHGQFGVEFELIANNEYLGDSVSIERRWRVSPNDKFQNEWDNPIEWLEVVVDQNTFVHAPHTDTVDTLYVQMQCRIASVGTRPPGAWSDSARAEIRFDGQASLPSNQ